MKSTLRTILVLLSLAAGYMLITTIKYFGVASSLSAQQAAEPNSGNPNPQSIEPRLPQKEQQNPKREFLDRWEGMSSTKSAVFIGPEEAERIAKSTDISAHEMMRLFREQEAKDRGR